MKNCLVHWCFDMLVDMSDHIRPEKGNMGTNCTKISSFSNTPSVKLAFWNLFKSDILVRVSFISCNRKRKKKYQLFFSIYFNLSIVGCYILIQIPTRTYEEFYCHLFFFIKGNWQIYFSDQNSKYNICLIVDTAWQLMPKTMMANWALHIHKNSV